MKENLEAASRILGRCFIFTFVMACIWFAAYIVPGDRLCNMQANMFGISLHECDLLTYGGIGLLKLTMWVFFFAPWLAIRLELRRLK